MTDLLIKTPAFYILLSLFGGDKHGYAIMKDVLDISEGEIKMGPATLYTTIKRLLGQGYVREVGEKTDRAHPGERRRYYSLTADGKTMVTSELGRIKRLVSNYSKITNGLAKNALWVLHSEL